MPLEQQVRSYLTFAFSSISCIASFFSIITITIKASKNFSVRYRMVLFLMIAHFLNSGNNSLMNWWINLHHGVLNPWYCTLNGFIGQFTVQAADFSILLIGIVTCITITNPMELCFSRIESFLPLAFFGIIGICTATSTIGLKTIGYDWLGNSGDWCWFSPYHSLSTTIRFTLTQGPRMAIFLVLILLYGKTFLFLRNLSRKTMMTEQIQWSMKSDKSANCHSFIEPKEPTSSDSSKSSSTLEQERIRSVQYKMLIFPIVYIIIWTPGIVNRIFDAEGKPNSITQLLQSLTQLMGFVDSLVYVYTLR